jgi:hypothetical protein
LRDSLQRKPPYKRTLIVTGLLLALVLMGPGCCNSASGRGMPHVRQ